MRVVVLYRPESENARRVEEYIANFQRIYPDKTLETFTVDSIEGTNMMGIYGITEHPAVLALANDGQMQQLWLGVDKMPLMNDLIYYINQ